MSQEHFVCAAGTGVIDAGATIGVLYRDGCTPVQLGPDHVVRSGTLIYADVQIGSNFQTGHGALVRERTTIGDHVLIGTGSIVDGHCSIGDFVKIESQCYIPSYARLGSRVFFGPRVTLTNDKYPLRQRDDYRPLGPVVEDNVTIGAGVVVCPGVRIGSGSFVAAGSVVTRDVPERTLAVGVPARHRPLPAHLDEPNTALSWRAHLSD